MLGNRACAGEEAWWLVFNGEAGLAIGTERA
jgi:hypothetical protein